MAGGWSSADLPILEPSPSLWPLSFAVEVYELPPPGTTVRQFRDAVRAAGVRPVGKMRFGTARHVPLYLGSELCQVAEEMHSPG